MSVLKEWRSLAERLIMKGKEIFDNSIVLESEVGTKDPKVASLALLARTVGNFEATLILLDAGKIVEARALVRCCFENLFWSAALAKKGDEFVRQMELDDAASRRKRAEGLLEWAGQQDHELEFVNKLEQFSEELDDKYPKASLISHKTAAEHGTVKPAYVFYGELSNDAAHPSATSLSRHVSWDDGENGSFTVHAETVPVEGEVEETYELGCTAMLGVCVAVNEALGGTKIGERLRDLGDAFRALSDKSKVKRETSNANRC